MKYIIIESKNAQELQTKVQYFIDKGWKPLGGLSVATHGGIIRL